MHEHEHPPISPALREQLAINRGLRRMVDQVMPDLEIKGRATVIRKADKEAAARGEHPFGDGRRQ